MSDLSYNDAILEVSDYLERKDTKSYRGAIRALETYKRNNVTDPVRSKAVDAILKYTKRQDQMERFTAFAKEKAKLSKKKVSELTQEDYLKFRRDFDRLESS